jgi:hypothetical protein
VAEIIHYLHVGKKHAIARASFNRDGEAAAFWRSKLDPANHAYIATVDRGIVGWLRYDLEGREGCCLKFWAMGTWVDTEHRDFGVAHELWRRVMRRYKPRRVIVTTITDDGRKFVAALVRWFPGVDFEVLAYRRGAA